MRSVAASNRSAFPQPFAPRVEGMFRDAVVFAELLNREAAARVLGEPLAPLVARAGCGLLLDGTVRHTPTMPRAAKVGKRGLRAAYEKPLQSASVPPRPR